MRGTEAECGPPSDREILVALYDATGGPAWIRDDELADRTVPFRNGTAWNVDDNGRVAMRRT